MLYIYDVPAHERYYRPATFLSWLAILGSIGACLDLLLRILEIRDMKADAAAAGTVGQFREMINHYLPLLTVNTSAGVIAAYLFFFIWQYRIHKNTQALTGRRLMSGPMAAIGWWFVPLLNWILPLAIVSEIASDNSSDREEAEKTDLIMWAWWLPVALGSIGGFVALVCWVRSMKDLNRFSRKWGDDDMIYRSSLFETYSGWQMFATVMAIIGWAATAYVIWMIQKQQSRLAQELDSELEWSKGRGRPNALGYFDMMVAGETSDDRTRRRSG